MLGDPVLLLLPQNAGKEEFERYRHLLGLDKPLYVQYWKFASPRGDRATSASRGTPTRPAFKLVLERMPPTIYLTFAGLLVALLIALPLGILAALKRHSWIDNLCTAVAVAGQAAPIFWLGIMLIIIFAVRLQASCPPRGTAPGSTSSCPRFCLGAALAPITMRLVRSGVIEVMNMEFIKTARAKGVAEPLVVVKHAFRNACIPVITVLGLQFGQLLGGAVITETVFAWPGVATLTVESIRNQDFPVVQCAVILLALVIVTVNLIVDVVVGFVDPRIRAADVKAVSAQPGGRARRPRPRRTRRSPDRASGRAPPAARGCAWGLAAAGSSWLYRGQRGLRAVDRAPRPARRQHPPPARPRRRGWTGRRAPTSSAPTRSAATSCPG